MNIIFEDLQAGAHGRAPLQSQRQQAFPCELKPIFVFFELFFGLHEAGFASREAKLGSTG